VGKIKTIEGLQQQEFDIIICTSIFLEYNVKRWQAM
jgi:reverse gyrase